MSTSGYLIIVWSRNKLTRFHTRSHGCIKSNEPAGDWTQDPITLVWCSNPWATSPYWVIKLIAWRLFTKAQDCLVYSNKSPILKGAAVEFISWCPTLLQLRKSSGQEVVGFPGIQVMDEVSDSERAASPSSDMRPTSLPNYVQAVYNDLRKLFSSFTIPFLSLLSPTADGLLPELGSEPKTIIWCPRSTTSREHCLNWRCDVMYTPALST